MVLLVNGMKNKVKKDGYALLASSKSILFTLTKSRKPTASKTGVVAVTGMARKKGLKNNEIKKQHPVIIALNPVLLPALMPAAL